MKTFVEYLTEYAAYHRDRRNIAIHCVGIPAIVAAVFVLLSRPAFGPGALAWLSPATLLLAASALFYLRLNRSFGFVMTLLLAACAALALPIAAGSTQSWLATGLGLFIGGWVLQFIGHYYEGKKPAFTDDLIGLAIGPLFVVAEIAWTLGLRHDLRDAVEAVSGPPLMRELGPGPDPHALA